MALRLPQVLTQLANKVKIKLGILGKVAAQHGDRKTVSDHVRYRLG